MEHNKAPVSIFHLHYVLRVFHIIFRRCIILLRTIIHAFKSLAAIFYIACVSRRFGCGRVPNKIRLEGRELGIFRQFNMKKYELSVETSVQSFRRFRLLEVQSEVTAGCKCSD